MNAAELIVEMLEESGVEYIFGVPGGAIEDLNTALFNSKKIKVIVTKHEQGAAYIADGYARVSGILGVCCSTAGPGATNLITGLATSYADFIPVCALTGQVATSVFGKGAIQESGAEGVNIVSIFRNFTKYSGLLGNEARIWRMTSKAIRSAYSLPRGPVHLSLPANIMKKQASNEGAVLHSDVQVFGKEAVKAAAKALAAAKRPVIIAGWGVALSRGADELLELARLLDIPVATSPKAKGVFPESHPLSLRGIGFAGSQIAKKYIIEDEVDVLLAVGTSFNEMMSSGWDERMLPAKHLIHVDVNPEQINKIYNTSIGVIGDAKTVLRELCFAVKREIGVDVVESRLRYTSARDDVKALRSRQASLDVRPADRDDLYHPQNLVLDIQKSFPQDTIYFADIGNVMAWAIRHLVMERPYSFFVSLGFGGMGYATAATVGARLASDDRPVVALAGDGGFLMNGTEIATAVNYDIPVVWIVFNNAMLGLVYHGRKLFKKPIPEGIPSRFERVDFAKVAEGLGARGIKIDKPGGITPDLINDVLASNRPTVLDVWIDEEAIPPVHSRIETVDKHFG